MWLVAPLSAEVWLVALSAVRPAPAPRCAVPPRMGERELDPRGFVVPQVGDVVKVPSKWPGEWDVAQVDFVQFVSSRQAYEVDLLPLKSVGQSLYRLPGRKPAATRSDVAKLSRLASEYVRESDAYRINEADLAPLGGRKQADPSVTEQGLEEYRALKATLLREAALLGAAGAGAGAFAYGGEVGSSVAAGAAAGCAYLWLLSREADGLGGDGPVSKAEALAVSGRLGVPVLLMAGLAAKNAVTAPGTGGALSALSKEQFFAAVAGFLSYKLPLLARQVARAVQELGAGDAQAGALPSGGGLGMALRLAQQRGAAKQEGAAAADAANAAGAPPRQGVPPALRAPEGGGARVRARAATRPTRAARQIVISGPSGVGKSSLVAKLLADLPGRVGFSVSCTTRPPREGEVDGVDYYFLPRADFERRVAAGDFIEYASVGAHLYGTSVQAVEEVSASGRACLLDIDVQGVQALRARPELRPLCVWIAPPSLAALRSRLEARGTDGGAEIESRLARARDEIEVALSARCFEQSVVNDDLDVAYAELKALVLAALRDA